MIDTFNFIEIVRTSNRTDAPTARYYDDKTRKTRSLRFNTEGTKALREAGFDRGTKIDLFFDSQSRTLVFRKGKTFRLSVLTGGKLQVFSKDLGKFLQPKESFDVVTVEGWDFAVRSTPTEPIGRVNR